MSTKLARWKSALRTLQVLKGKYPVFATGKPLKIGIADDLRAALPDINATHLQRAVAFHTSSISYQRALTQGGPRFDLDGNVSGEIDAQQIEHAKLKLARL